MKPTAAVNIVDKDQTGPGLRSAEARFGKFARKTEKFADKSGFGKIGRLVSGLTKFRTMNFGGSGLAAIGQFSSTANANVSALSSNMAGLGHAGEDAMGKIAGASETAAGAVAGVAAAVVGVGVATYMLGDKWAKTGAEVQRTAKSLGASTGFLQRARAENERFGVSADQTTSSLDALGSTLYNAKYGANNEALAVLNQVGVKLKENKDGVIDLEAAYYDLSDAIARQKNPYAANKLASIFGLSGSLPALRQGAAALKAEGADYDKTGAALSPEEAAKATDVNRKTVALRQHLSVFEKAAGVAAMNVTGMAAGGALTGEQKARGAIASIATQGKALVHGGEEAARRLIEGGREAGRAIGSEFEKFVGRIEHQESRGRQLDKSGNPLTSSAGAIGAMQMLPDTARRAAARAGLPWDPQRFRTDKAYNEALGRAELQRLTDKFGGDEVLAAAAYNAGEGQLTGYRKNGRRHPGWLETIGDPRKGEISDAEFAAQIPFKETRDYVANTARAHVRIELAGAPPGTTATVSGGAGVDVDMRIAHGMTGP